MENQQTPEEIELNVRLGLLSRGFTDVTLLNNRGLIGAIIEETVSNTPTSAKLQAFKDYVHKRLDDAGIEKEPNGEHSKSGCRIGDRLDIVLHHQEAIAELRQELSDKDTAFILSRNAAKRRGEKIKQLQEANAKLVEEIERLKLIVEGKELLQKDLVIALKAARKLIEEKDWCLSSEYLTICQAIKLTK